MNIDIEILVWLPWSWKSYYTKQLDNNYIIFSSDNYRLKILSDENDQTQNDLVFWTMFNDCFNEIIQCLNTKKYIIDSTSINKKDRLKFINFLGTKQKEFLKVWINSINIIYKVFNIFPEFSYKQNLQRDRKLPFEIISKVYKRFQYPLYKDFQYFKLIKLNYKIEHIDNNILFNQQINNYIWYIKELIFDWNLTNFDNLFEIWKIKELWLTHWNSIYHKESVYNHIYNVFSNSLKLEAPIEVKLSTLFHDFWKLYAYNNTDYKWNIINKINFNWHEWISYNLYKLYKPFLYTFINTLDVDIAWIIIKTHYFFDYISIEDLSNYDFQYLKDKFSKLLDKDEQKMIDIKWDDFYRLLLIQYICDKFWSVRDSYKNEMIKISYFDNLFNK